MYPEIEPFYSGELSVSPTHTLYVERSGKLGGCPIFFLHGGPGSCSNGQHRRYFDPEFFDIVLFDQRGCGKSTPLGELVANDTWALVEDIHAIKTALNITGKINLFGGSWGSSLALAYASVYPNAVNELVLRGVFLCSREEVQWYTHGLSRFFPAAWEQFATPNAEDLVAHYYQAINDENKNAALLAAQHWVRYERQIMSLGDASTPSDGIALPLPSAALMAKARVQLHYLHNDCFLQPNQLLDYASNISCPTTIVQGQMDMVCPPISAHRLGQALPNATLRMVSDAGHSGLSERLAGVLTEEANSLRERIRRNNEPAL